MLNFMLLPESKAYSPPFSVKIDNVTCYGKSDGSIEIFISDETPEAYNIEVRSYSAGLLARFDEKSASPFTLRNLKADNYTIWYSTNKNKVSIHATIENPEVLKANTISIENINGEHEALRASLKANPSGGTVPYSITWSENTNNQQGAIAEDLPLGIYRCKITDSNGCGPVSATYFLAESEIEKFKKEIPEK